MATKPPPPGHKWININSFINKYRSILPMDLFSDLSNYSMQGHNKAYLTISTIEELDKRLAKQKEEDKKLANVAKLNNKGIAYEKAGNIKMAIKTYEKNIESDYPAHHSHKRLMVLYRKNKDYENELRVIERAIEVFRPKSQEAEYVERLEKVKSYLSKL